MRVWRLVTGCCNFIVHKAGLAKTRSIFAYRYSQFRDEYSLEAIMKSPKIHDPLTKLQCWYVSMKVIFNGHQPRVRNELDVVH